MALRWRCAAVLVLFRLLLILAPISCQTDVLDCDSFKHNFTNIFREYVSIPDSHYEALYREWNSFCLGLDSSQSLSPAAVQLAWSRFTTFRPLSSCQPRASEEQSVSTSTARAVASPTTAHSFAGGQAEAVSVCPCLVVSGDRAVGGDAAGTDIGPAKGGAAVKALASGGCALT